MATSDTEVFEAALRGDCDTLRRLLPSQASRTTPEGYAPLGLTVSAGHVESARLLLAHGAAVDQQDAAGVSALMHACMHGYAELCNLLLLHGAKPLLRNREALSCVSLAARYGRPGALAVLFREDGALVESRDGLGRSPLHWAVCSKHLPTVKYMLGRWHADVHVVDRSGDSPLHLVGDQQDVLLMLYNGTATRPLLTLLNHAGQTPADAAEAVGADTALALRDESWLLHARSGSGDDREWSFLLESPLRRPPRRTPPASWFERVGADGRAAVQHCLVALAPLLVPLALAHGFSALGAFGAFGACVLAISLLACHRGAVRARQGLRGVGVSLEPAAILFGTVCAASYVLTTTLLLRRAPAGTGTATATANGTGAIAPWGALLALAGYWAAYARLQRLDPGFLPGADAPAPHMRPAAPLGGTGRAAPGARADGKHRGKSRLYRTAS